MSRAIWWLILISGFVLVAAIGYYGLLGMNPEQPPAQPAMVPAIEPPVIAEPRVQHPIAQRSDEKPLPALNVSDATIKNALDGLLPEQALVQLFHLNDFVRRVVATVDNLPRNRIALRLMPVKPAGGRFLVTGRDGSLAISPDNSARYAPYLRLADALDARKLVALYTHFYPLFQQAYVELGYPKGYFNDRLVEVIDHLLATPEVNAPIKLVQPKVFYLYADRETEALSAGQKLLIRIGRENAAKIRTKLREIRNELASRQPPVESKPAVAR